MPVTYRCDEDIIFTGGPQKRKLVEELLFQLVKETKLKKEEGFVKILLVYIMGLFSIFKRPCTSWQK